MRSAWLAACGGFLVAVVWMDLMFDVQTLGLGVAPGTSPEVSVISIAAYYRRVTTDAAPMGYLVGVIMLLTVAGTASAARTVGAWGWLALVLCASPIALAALRVFPNAVRLGSGVDPFPEQLALARAICRDHLLCLTAIAAFTATQLRRARLDR